MHQIEPPQRRDHNLEKWPPERIERERLEIERAKATCVPEVNR
ncbi:hypothetical protein [Natrinema pallidum]|nr:hypothetical protein [Natrinema pallidum]